ncbi:ABC transporter G family member 37 [Hordeum vulgare]|nr:ABC transporter G family member 37 [Hordeum vulgare]
MQLVRSGNTAFNINGEVGPFFQASGGVKQGDPISPMPFNLAVDALAGIFDKAKLAGHLQGVVGHLIPGGGVTHLQYANDTMIMVEGSDSDIAHLKFLLLCFEEMSRIKINIDKSEVVVLGYSKAEQHRIADNLNCRLSSFPVSYLGMPLAESRILLSGFDPLVERVASRAEP